MVNVMIVSLISALPIPFISIPVLLYTMAILVFVLMTVHKLSIVKAIIVAILPMALLFGLAFVAGVSYFTGAFL